MNLPLATDGGVRPSGEASAPSARAGDREPVSREEPPRSGPERGRGAELARVAGFAAVYAIVCHVWLLVPELAGVVSSIWPAVGVVVAGLLLLPPRRWVGLLAVIAVISIGSRLAFGRPLVAVVGYTIVNVGEPLLVAWLLTRWRGAGLTFTRMGEVLSLLGATLIAASGSALLGATTGVLAGGTDWPLLFRTWWVANVLGVMLVTPLLVVWLRPADDGVRLRRWRWRLELAGAVALAAALAWSYFGVEHERTAIRPHSYFLFLPLGWAALRLGVRGVTLTLAVLAVVEVALTVTGSGGYPLGGDNADERLFWVQFFIAVKTVAGLLLAASLAERQGAIEAVRESERRLRTLGDNLPNSALYQMVQEPDGTRRFVHASAGLGRINGVSTEAILRDGRALYDLVPPEDQVALEAARAAAERTMSVFTVVIRIRRPDGGQRWLELASTPHRLPDGRMAWDGFVLDVTDRRRAELRLQESEVRFRQMFEHSLDAILVSKDGGVIFVNPAFLALFGWERHEDVVGRRVAEFVAPEHRDLIHERVRARMAGDQAARRMELRGWRRPGEAFDMEVHSSTFRLDGESHVMAIVRDISERTRAEAELRRTQELYRAIVEDQTEMIVRWRPDATLTFVNEAYVRACGRPRDGVLGASFLDFVAESDRTRVRAAIAELTPTVPMVTAVQRWVRPDGTPGWQEWSHRGLFDEPGRLREVQSVGRDITARRQAETEVRELLAEAEQGRAALLSILEDQQRVEAERERLVRDLGERVKELTALHRTARLLQLDRPFDAVLLAELVALLPPAWQHTDVAVARIRYGDLIAESPGWVEPPWRQTAAFATQDGRAGLIEVGYREARPDAVEGPFLAEERHLIQSLADLLLAHLERLHAVQALGWSEARFRSAMLDSAIGMALVATDGRWLEVNPALSRIVGYTRAELLMLDFQHLTYRDDLAADLDRLRRMLAGETSTFGWEKRYRHKDGHLVWVQLNVSLVRDAQGQPLNFITQVQDITARKRAEESLAAAAERLALALRASQLGVWRHHLQTRATEWDARMFAIFGLPVAARAPGYEEILASFAEEDRPRVQRSWEQAAVGSRGYHERFRVVHPDGSVHHVELQAVVHPDEDGRPGWVMGVAGDVTGIVQAAAEAERLRAQLLHAQKMETLGTLAAGVAHDFNNLLTGINGFVDLAATSLPEGHEAGELLKQARRGAMSARDLVRRILNFSRHKTESTQARVEVGELVRETAPLIAAALPASVSLALAITPGLAPVLADASQLQQVLMNLCVNGAHAIGPGAGTVRVAVDRCLLGPGGEAAAPPGSPAGGYVRITVGDTGCGMDAATLQRIFEPFFTTKKAGEGTGLGLSIVRDIALAHKGEITARSTPGAGTIFTLVLPEVAPEPAPAGAGLAAGSAGGQGQRILVVDDEPTVAMVLRLTLQRSGYQPEVYTSPEEAWTRLTGGGGAFDLLMIDENMPGLSGPEFVQRLSTTAASLPVILMSGRFERSSDDTGAEDSVTRLKKPFAIAELLGAVRATLERAGSRPG